MSWLSLAAMLVMTAPAWAGEAPTPIEARDLALW